MSETIITKTEDAADDATADLAQTVGETKAHVEHAADAIDEHTEKLANVEGDAQWTKERISSLESTVLNIPSTIAQAVETETASLRSTVASLTEKLSEQVPVSGETTSAPEPVHNKAEKAKPKNLWEWAKGLL